MTSCTRSREGGGSLPAQVGRGDYRGSVAGYREDQAVYTLQPLCVPGLPYYEVCDRITCRRWFVDKPTFARLEETISFKTGHCPLPGITRINYFSVLQPTISSADNVAVVIKGSDTHLQPHYVVCLTNTDTYNGAEPLAFTWTSAHTRLASQSSKRNLYDSAPSDQLTLATKRDGNLIPVSNAYGVHHIPGVYATSGPVKKSILGATKVIASTGTFPTHVVMITSKNQGQTSHLAETQSMVTVPSAGCLLVRARSAHEVQVGQVLGQL